MKSMAGVVMAVATVAVAGLSGCAGGSRHGIRQVAAEPEHQQRFCAVAPASGVVRYGVGHGAGRLVVHVHRVPARDGLYAVVWGPGGGHEGEDIASVRIRDGSTRQQSLQFFHSPYYNRPGVVVDLVSRSEHVVAAARPC